MWKKRRTITKKASKPLVKIILPILILTIIFLVFTFANIGFFTIKQIEVEAKGLSCVGKDQLRDSSGLLGQNFFFLNNSKIVENLKKKFLCIKTVNLEKFLPDKVKLQASVRQPLGLLINLKEKEASISSLIESTATPSAENIEGYYLVDNEMVVFAEGTNESSLPKVYISDVKISLGNILKSTPKEKAMKILNKVKAFNVNISQSWIYENFFVIGQKGINPTIIFRLDKDIDVQLASLQLILTEAKINRRTIPSSIGIDLEELEFIDLRFDKPVIRTAPLKKN